VEDSVLVEVKSVAELLPIHRAQVRSYLRLARLPVGLLLNFNVEVLRLGIARVPRPEWRAGDRGRNSSSR
jgi:GxxExxY protein